MCPGLHSIKCKTISISVTKCFLALIVNFAVTSGEKYRQERSLSVLLTILLEESSTVTRDTSGGLSKFERRPNYLHFWTYDHGQISLGHLLLFQSSAHSSGFRCLPPLPLINVGHKLVHFQLCILFSLHFSQATLNWGGVEGVAKEPRICDKK